MLETEEYKALLQHLRNTDESIWDYQAMPHPPNSKVFEPYAVPRDTWRGSKSKIVSVMKPINCVKYKDEGKTLYGVVRQIYVYSNPKGLWETALLVNPITNLFPKLTTSPSHEF